jgi:hypothetical protein
VIRAVLFATGEAPADNPLGPRHLLPMLPLLDRPFLQHVIEFLAAQGVTEYDIVLSHLPEVVERHLGDGTRWGCRLTYHLARDPARPYEVLSRLGPGPDGVGRVLLGHVDRVPVVRFPWDEGPGATVLFVSPGPTANNPARRTGPDEWTGWGLVTARDLRAVPRDLPAAGLYAHLRSAAPAVVLSRATPVLSVQSPAGVLASQRAVLDGQVEGLMFGGREVAPGAWVARTAKVSPTAKLIAPVYIGPYCTVAGGAQVGPHTVVASGCLIDRGSRLSNTGVLAESYVGEGMALDGALVDRDLAVLPGANSAKLFSDPLALGKAPSVSLPHLVRSGLTCLVALTLLTAAAPLLLLTALVLALLRGVGPFHSRVVVRLPVPRPEGPWPTCRLYRFAGPAWRRPGLRHLLLDVLPGLVHVVGGRLQFVGVSPRSVAEVNSMPPEWRALYLGARAGLLSSALLGPGPEGAGPWAADAADAVSPSWRQSLRVLAAYLWQALQGPNALPPVADGPGPGARSQGPSIREGASSQPLTGHPGPGA